MDYIKPVEIDLNEMDDEPLALYFDKKARKEQFVKQIACILNQLILDSGQEMQNNRCSPTTGLQE
ncbi:hypothetical protein ACFP56_16685 [Paenibacillus septentrionalis]|uniref:Uncharacterized protein n=1 Tax=Paenibacillus septentrionalis TaxID=429342 RepID=A0ABW1V650_9BACL